MAFVYLEGVGMSVGTYGCNPASTQLFGNSKKFENPYLDFASKSVPRTFSDVIDWSEHVVSLSDDLGDGLRKLYTYFCTPVDIGVLETEQKEFDSANALKWEVGLIQKLGYQSEVTQLGRNVSVYGNDFVTITLKHQRLIGCPDCGWEVGLDLVRDFPGIDFKFKDMVFSGFCQSKQCQGRGRKRFLVRHVYDRSFENLVFKHWPIRELEFDFMEMTNTLRVYWRIPNRIKNRVLSDNDPETIHDLDLSVLRCICEGKLLEFDDRVMFHGKEPHLSGLENRGLGIPRTLSLARQHWLIQLLKKQCQALASDYVTPMGFFSMDQRGSAQSMDPIQSVDSQVFGNYIENMVEAHRKDPRAKYYVPFPVNFQYAGAGGDQFVPATLLQYFSQDLSNSLVPMSILRGDLSAQAAPMFLRLFEAFNREIPVMYNRFLWFTVSRVAELLRTSEIGCMHQSASVADNLNVDAMLMESSAMGRTSNYSWMRRLGLNPQTENNRKLTEARSEMEFQQELQAMQEELGFQGSLQQQAQAPLMEAAADPQQQQGGPQGGGAPGGPAGGAPPQGGMQMGMGPSMLPSQGYVPPMDIGQMEADAQQMAEVLGGLPQAQRNQELAVLRQDHQAFHALVTTELEKLRQNVAYQARNEVAPNL